MSARAGLPNAGKSTFIRAVSRPVRKVAVPFTALVNLGVVRGENSPFLRHLPTPGLASLKGLPRGRTWDPHFLKHLERCRV